VKTCFLFKLSNPESSWTIDLTTPPGSVTEGAAGKPACTLDISDADFMAMATGQADAMKLWERILAGADWPSFGHIAAEADVARSRK
jgi:hypothetical protein